MIKETAVLLFANSGSAEIANKSIRKSEVLFNKLNEYILDTVQESRLPYFLISDKEQVGNSFGERFVNAIEFVFDKGYQNVIAIGNDSPQLKLKHLIETAKALTNNKFALGSSLDGGFYLMGIQKHLFDSNQFLEINWNTRSVSEEVLKIIRKVHSKIYRLEVLVDIDEESDLQILTTFFHQISRQIRLTILSIFLERVSIKPKVLSFFKNRKTAQYFNKGSPLAIV